MIRGPWKKHKGKRFSPNKVSEEGGKRKIFVMTVAIAAAVASLGAVGFGLHSLLSRSDFFQITSIKINGARKVDKGTVLELSGIDIHTNLLRVNPCSLGERLAAHPWIKNAEVRRDFPNRLLVSVNERRPVALIAGENGLHYIDAGGTIFAPVQSGDDLDFPVITGVNKKKLLAGEQSESLADALKLLSTAGRRNSNLPRQNISQLHFAEEEELVLFLVDRPFPIYLGCGEMRKKFGQLARVLGWLYKENEFMSTKSIRLDYFDNKVLVERAGSG